MPYSSPRNTPDTVDASLSLSSYSWYVSRRTSIETVVSVVHSDPLMTATGLARIGRNMVPWHGATSDTAMTSTPSHTADMVHGVTSSSAAERKQIHVTLLTAPWLRSSDSNQEHILCEICLDDVKSCRQILKTSCCRLLAHNTCLSRWADTNAQGRLQNGISFTCPKCRTVMDLAKFKQQLPRVIGLAEKLGSGSSYDIDVTFTPLSQLQQNAWDAPLQRPGRLQQRYVVVTREDYEEISETDGRSDANSRLSSRSHSSVLARGLREYSLYQRTTEWAPGRRIFRPGNEPPRFRRETERLRQEMEHTEAQQVTLYQYQGLVIEQHRWWMVQQQRQQIEQYRPATEQRLREASQRSQEVERQRQEITQRRREAVERERREAVERQTQEEAERQEQEAERQKQEAEFRQYQAERERYEDACKMQNAERVRKREAVRQNTRSTATRQCGTHRRRNGNQSNQDVGCTRSH
jgi:hypothetical protein